MYVCLQYADENIEWGVPQNRIRPQKFVVDDLVEVNCGGKGEWHAAKVVDVDGDTYKVKYGNKSFFAKAVPHSTTKDRIIKKSTTKSNRAESKRRRMEETVSLKYKPVSSKSKRPCASHNPDPISSKLTKSEAMTRLRETLRDFSTSAMMSTEKFKFKFVPGINELTFKDDDRFDIDNLIFDQHETTTHAYIRDGGCLGSRSPVNVTNLQVGHNTTQHNTT